MAHRRAPGADFDLDETWYYVAKESGSLERADRLIKSITDRFYMLSGNPRMGRARDDLRPGLRSFPVGQYVIVYRIEDGKTADESAVDDLAAILRDVDVHSPPWLS